MAALARTLRSLAVALVAFFVAANSSGFTSFSAQTAEAQTAGELTVAIEAKSTATEKTACACPSEMGQAEQDDGSCISGLVQDQVPETRAPPASRGGVPPDYLFGLARGPEPAPPRSFG